MYETKPVTCNASLTRLSLAQLCTTSISSNSSPYDANTNDMLFMESLPLGQFMLVCLIRTVTILKKHLLESVRLVSNRSVFNQTLCTGRTHHVSDCESEEVGMRV